MKKQRWRQSLPALVLMLAPALAGSAPAPATTADEPMAGFQERAELWLRRGWDGADPVLAEVARALAVPGLAPQRVRILQRTRGAVAARGGREGQAQEALRALDDLAAAGDALARPDAALVRALLEEQQGHGVQAAGHARDAADAYAAVCGRGLAQRADCDPRAQWLALHTLMQRERRDAEPESAIARAEEAIALAGRAADPALQAWTVAVEASLRAAQGESAQARQGIARAQALLRELSRPDIEARVWLLQMRVATATGEVTGVDDALQAAFAAARRANSPRLVASVQISQSDLMVRRRRPGRALAAVQAALPVVRRFADWRLERVLLHNGALAHIALGHAREAKLQADRLFELWASDATPGEQSLALREVADALAAAGDARAALDLYHRERDLTDRVMEARREAAERRVRARYDRDAEQRSIELMTRDNAVQAAELDNRVLAERLWALAAAAVGLGALLVGLLLHRVRATQSALRRSQAQLKAQSERDPLTGAANRRHGQARLQAESEAGAGGWRGAMLLVDVDHFKRVNDEYGHAAGDLVLVEVARRLQAAVRGDDVVLRWGGEEFLVLAANERDGALDTLAARLMRAVGATPLTLPGGKAIEVTVSIGYAAFPLAPREQALGWERALNLVDMALYTAKNQGRHRAVGVVALADDDAALADAERDFERACETGRVRLAIEAGA